MALVQEITPMLVLAETSPARIAFRFRNRAWALATLAAALALGAATGWACARHRLDGWDSAPLWALAAVLLYSTLYSATSRQELVFDGLRGLVSYRKRSLYGREAWERPGTAFLGLRVTRLQTGAGRASRSWYLLLEEGGSRSLCLGEREVGFLRRERALALARRIEALTGLPVIDASAPAAPRAGVRWR